MGGRADGFRPTVDGSVGRLSPGSEWLTDFPDFVPTAFRSPMEASLITLRRQIARLTVYRRGNKQLLNHRFRELHGNRNEDGVD